MGNKRKKIVVTSNQDTRILIKGESYAVTKEDEKFYWLEDFGKLKILKTRFRQFSSGTPPEHN